jgi:hypothetical protein
VHNLFASPKAHGIDEADPRHDGERTGTAVDVM